MKLYGTKGLRGWLQIYEGCKSGHCQKIIYSTETRTRQQQATIYIRIQATLPKLVGNFVVLGAGDVAMDCARTALRWFE